MMNNKRSTGGEIQIAFMEKIKDCLKNQKSLWGQSSLLCHGAFPAVGIVGTWTQ